MDHWIAMEWLQLGMGADRAVHEAGGGWERRQCGVGREMSRLEHQAADCLVGQLERRSACISRSRGSKTIAELASGGRAGRDWPTGTSEQPQVVHSIVGQPHAYNRLLLGLHKDDACVQPMMFFVVVIALVE